MTAEEWQNAARNSWITNIGRRNPNATNGYSTTMPSYNPYSSQFRRMDYTQPIQNAQTPPINQALTENFQPQYIQATDYNGQPVRVPSNALSQAAEYVPGVLTWGAGQLAENALFKGLTGKSLGDWVLLGARKAAPKVAGSIVGGPIGATIAWAPEAVETAKYLLSTPAAKTLGNGIKHIINWGL